MRKTVAGPVAANKGQIVRFHLQLRSDQHYAFCQLYSAFPGDYEPAPHIQLDRLALLENKRPRITSPVSLRLLSGRNSDVLLELDVTRECRLYIMQEVDQADDETIKATGRTYGKWKERALSAIRRVLGNEDWPVRSDYGQVVRLDL